MKKVLSVILSLTLSLASPGLEGLVLFAETATAVRSLPKVDAGKALTTLQRMGLIQGPGDSLFPLVYDFKTYELTPLGVYLYQYVQKKPARAQELQMMLKPLREEKSLSYTEDKKKRVEEVLKKFDQESGGMDSSSQEDMFALGSRLHAILSEIQTPDREEGSEKYSDVRVGSEVLQYSKDGLVARYDAQTRKLLWSRDVYQQQLRMNAQRVAEAPFIEPTGRRSYSMLWHPYFEIKKELNDHWTDWHAGRTQALARLTGNEGKYKPEQYRDEKNLEKEFEEQVLGPMLPWHQRFASGVVGMNAWMTSKAAGLLLWDKEKGKEAGRLVNRAFYEIPAGWIAEKNQTTFLGWVPFVGSVKDPKSLKAKGFVDVLVDGSFQKRAKRLEEVQKYLKEYEVRLNALSSRTDITDSERAVLVAYERGIKKILWGDSLESQKFNLYQSKEMLENSAQFHEINQHLWSLEAKAGYALGGFLTSPMSREERLLYLSRREELAERHERAMKMVERLLKQMEDPRSDLAVLMGSLQALQMESMELQSDFMLYSGIPGMLKEVHSHNSAAHPVTGIFSRAWDSINLWIWPESEAALSVRKAWKQDVVLQGIFRAIAGGRFAIARDMAARHLDPEAIHVYEGTPLFGRRSEEPSQAQHIQAAVRSTYDVMTTLKSSHIVPDALNSIALWSVGMAVVSPFAVAALGRGAAWARVAAGRAGTAASAAKNPFARAYYNLKWMGLEGTKDVLWNARMNLLRLEPELGTGYWAGLPIRAANQAASLGVFTGVSTAISVPFGLAYHASYGAENSPFRSTGQAVTESLKQGFAWPTESWHPLILYANPPYTAFKHLPNVSVPLGLTTINISPSTLARSIADSGPVTWAARGTRFFAGKLGMRSSWVNEGWKAFTDRAAKAEVKVPFAKTPFRAGSWAVTSAQMADQVSKYWAFAEVTKVATEQFVAFKPKFWEPTQDGPEESASTTVSAYKWGMRTMEWPLWLLLPVHPSASQPEIRSSIQAEEALHQYFKADRSYEIGNRPGKKVPLLGQPDVPGIQKFLSVRVGERKGSSLVEISEEAAIQAVKDDLTLMRLTPEEAYAITRMKAGERLGRYQNENVRISRLPEPSLELRAVVEKFAAQEKQWAADRKLGKTQATFSELVEGWKKELSQTELPEGQGELANLWLNGLNKVKNPTSGTNARWSLNQVSEAARGEKVVRRLSDGMEIKNYDPKLLQERLWVSDNVTAEALAVHENLLAGNTGKIAENLIQDRDPKLREHVAAMVLNSGRLTRLGYKMSYWRGRLVERLSSGRKAGVADVIAQSREILKDKYEPEINQHQAARTFLQAVEAMGTPSFAAKTFLARMRRESKRWRAVQEGRIPTTEEGFKALEEAVRKAAGQKGRSPEHALKRREGLLKAYQERYGEKSYRELISFWEKALEKDSKLNKKEKAAIKADLDYLKSIEDRFDRADLHDPRGKPGDEATRLKGWRPEQFDVLVQLLAHAVEQGSGGIRNIRAFLKVSASAGKTPLELLALLSLAEEDAALRGISPENVLILTTQNNLESQLRLYFKSLGILNSKARIMTWERYKTMLAEAKMGMGESAEKFWVIGDEMDGVALQPQLSIGKITAEISPRYSGLVELKSLEENIFRLSKEMASDLNKSSRESKAELIRDLVAEHKSVLDLAEPKPSKGGGAKAGAEKNELQALVEKTLSLAEIGKTAEIEQVHKDYAGLLPQRIQNESKAYQVYEKIYDAAYPLAQSAIRIQNHKAVVRAMPENILGAARSEGGHLLARAEAMRRVYGRRADAIVERVQAFNRVLEAKAEEVVRSYEAIPEKTRRAASENKKTGISESPWKWLNEKFKKAEPEKKEVTAEEIEALEIEALRSGLGELKALASEQNKELRAELDRVVSGKAGPKADTLDQPAKTSREADLLSQTLSAREQFFDSNLKRLELDQARYEAILEKNLIRQSRQFAQELFEAISSDPFMEPAQRYNLMSKLLDSMEFRQAHETLFRYGDKLSPALTSALNNHLSSKPVEVQGKITANSWMAQEMLNMALGYLDDMAHGRYDNKTGQYIPIHNGEWVPSMDIPTLRYWQIRRGLALKMPYEHETVATIKDVTDNPNARVIGLSGSSSEYYAQLMRKSKILMMGSGMPETAPVRMGRAYNFNHQLLALKGNIRKVLNDPEGFVHIYLPDTRDLRVVRNYLLRNKILSREQLVQIYSDTEYLRLHRPEADVAKQMNLEAMNSGKAKVALWDIRFTRGRDTNHRGGEGGFKGYKNIYVWVLSPENISQPDALQARARAGWGRVPKGAKVRSFYLFNMQSIQEHPVFLEFAREKGKKQVDWEIVTGSRPKWDEVNQRFIEVKNLDEAMNWIEEAKLRSSGVLTDSPKIISPKKRLLE